MWKLQKIKIEKQAVEIKKQAIQKFLKIGFTPFLKSL